MEISWLDIVILIPVAYGLGHGLLRGFVRELTSILAILGGVLAGKFFAPKFAAYLLTVINMPERAALFLAYFLLFISVALLCKLLAQSFTKFLRKVDLNWLNRLVGAAFGALMWAMIVSLALNLIALIEPYYPVFKPEAKQTSQLYEPTLRLASVAKTQAEKYLKIYADEVAEEQAKEKAKEAAKQKARKAAEQAVDTTFEELENNTNQ